MTGGISYISRKYGWGVDNVRNYEVSRSFLIREDTGLRELPLLTLNSQIVLANGSIGSVNQFTHPDLYWALRGGGGNFGIITRFDMETYSLEPMYGGFYFIPLAETNDHLHSLKMPRVFSWTLKLVIEKSAGFLVRLACRVGYCTTFDAMTDILEDLAVNGSSDPYAQAYSVLVKVPYINQYIYVIQMTHGGGRTDSTAFANLNTLKYVWNTGTFQWKPL